MSSRMPEQKPGRSEQVVVTPWALIDAVERRFGAIVFDLAASKGNARVRAGEHCYFGQEQNSLGQHWANLRGNLWLNPPYGKTDEAPHGIADWASKCAESAKFGDPRKIPLLIPAGVGSNWFANHIYKKALVLFLQGRVTFEGHTQCYPKDLMICCYGEKPGIEVWDWRRQK